MDFQKYPDKCGQGLSLQRGKFYWSFCLVSHYFNSLLAFADFVQLNNYG